jgi:hypothetical protein
MLYLVTQTKWLCLFCLWLSVGSLYAQNKETEASQEKQSFIDAISVSTGTNALVGFDLRHRLNDRWTARAGFNHMHFNIRAWETNFNRFAHYASINLDVRQSSFSLLFDYSLGEKGFVKLVSGLGFFIDNRISGSVRLADNFTFNDIDFEPDELGYVYGGVQFKNPVNPYLGIALGRMRADKRLNFGVDIGTFYKGKPYISIAGTNLLRNNEHNSEVLTENFSAYRWYPVLSFRLSYTIHPVKNVIQNHHEE